VILALLLGAADPAAVEAPDPIVVALVAREDGRQCLPDGSLCLDLPVDVASGETGGLRLSTGGADDNAFALPYAQDDGESLRLWPYLVAVPRAEEAEPGFGHYLMGVVVSVNTMYSGGGGSGGRLHLLRLDTTPATTRLGDEVLDVVWDSSLMIRACFSEDDMKLRRGACHDEYGFTGTLAAGPDEVAELPALIYRSVATAYPQTSRRTNDNGGAPLRNSDLVKWQDPECSYERVLHYNPATARYEMDRPAPDCSDYTTP
jgi:hypothetical protein